MLKVIKSTGSFFLLFLITFIVLEIFLRCYGYSPINPLQNEEKIKCKPSPLFQFHPDYGYVYEPGNKEVILNGSLGYTLNVNEAGFRINSYSVCPSKQASIAVFGCSFFGGMGVDDDEVLSAHLQRFVGDTCVYNYAIPGQGMNMQLLKLQDLIENEQKPEIAVFELASFHLIRNPGGFNFVKNFADIRDRPSYYLCSELSDDDKLNFFLKDINENLCFLDYWSAAYHLLKVKFYANQFKDEYLLDLENSLIQEAYSLCNEHEVIPVFMLITKDVLSSSIANFLESKNIPFIVSSVDYQSDEFNLNPHDQHPNAFAHERYALEIFDFIKNVQFR